MNSDVSSPIKYSRHHRRVPRSGPAEGGAGHCANRNAISQLSIPPGTKDGPARSGPDAPSGAPRQSRNVADGSRRAGARARRAGRGAGSPAAVGSRAGAEPQLFRRGIGRPVFRPAIECGGIGDARGAAERSHLLCPPPHGLRAADAGAGRATADSERSNSRAQRRLSQNPEALARRPQRRRKPPADEAAALSKSCRAISRIRSRAAAT